MKEERDFDHIEPVFFTTSNVGGKGPDIGREVPPLKDANSIDDLKLCDTIITCQGGDYTKRSIQSCVPPAGKATGSMLPRPCG